MHEYESNNSQRGDVHGGSGGIFGVISRVVGGASGQSGAGGSGVYTLLLPNCPGQFPFLAYFVLQAVFRCGYSISCGSQ